MLCQSFCSTPPEFKALEPTTVPTTPAWFTRRCNVRSWLSVYAFSRSRVRVSPCIPFLGMAIGGIERPLVAHIGIDLCVCCALVRMADICGVILGASCDKAVVSYPYHQQLAR